MAKKIVGMCIFLAVLAGWPFQAGADDLDDGISEYTDENVSADDNIGSNKDNNINFIVVDAIGKAKTGRRDKGTEKANAATERDEISNFSNGGDHNENSVVVGAGSRVDKVYNIVIEK